MCTYYKPFCRVLGESYGEVMLGGREYFLELGSSHSAQNNLAACLILTFNS